jgi:hypothetical protein
LAGPDQSLENSDPSDQEGISIAGTPPTSTFSHYRSTDRG